MKILSLSFEATIDEDKTVELEPKFNVGFAKKTLKKWRNEDQDIFGDEKIMMALSFGLANALKEKIGEITNQAFIISQKILNDLKTELQEAENVEL
jgi:hypothetical protein